MADPIKRYHVEKGAIFDGNYILDGSISADKLKPSALRFELALPLVTYKQEYSNFNLQDFYGDWAWQPNLWNLDLIESVAVEIEYECSGECNIDLYDALTSSKVADILNPTSSVSHSLSYVDVTEAIKNLSSTAILYIRATSGGDISLTIYKAYLSVVIST